MHPANQTLPTQVLRLREAMAMRFRSVLSPNEVTDAQWRIFRVLLEVEKIDFATLAERAIIAKPSLSRVIAMFETRGLVKREDHPTDQRQFHISLTEEGTVFAHTIKPKVDDIYASLVRDLGEERIDALSALLVDCITILENAPHNVDTIH